MKMTSAQCKMLAKRMLLGNYGAVCGAILIGYLLQMVANVPALVLQTVGQIGWMSLRDPESPVIWIIPGFILCYLLNFLLGILVSNGILRICLQVCAGEKVRLDMLFFAATHHPLRFLGLALILVLMSLGAMLPGMACLFLGIEMDSAVGVAVILVGYLLSGVFCVLVMLRYSFASIALVENPERAVMECLRYSKMLMKGEMWRVLRFWFSCIGILLLGYISFGIGFLWISPYICCSLIFLYKDLQWRKDAPESLGF